MFVTPNVPCKVALPLTVKISSIVVVPPAESIVKLPELVSISLSLVTPIWISSILAPPLASIVPVNVDTPVTFNWLNPEVPTVLIPATVEAVIPVKFDPSPWNSLAVTIPVTWPASILLWSMVTPAPSNPLVAVRTVKVGLPVTAEASPCKKFV